MKRFADFLDRLNRAVARFASYGTLGMVGITFIVVLLRYGFSVGWVWMQEAVLYLHSAVFLLAAGATLGNDGHVRVDIFYQRVSERARLIIDVVGTLVFLFPFCALVIAQSYPFVIASFQVWESSQEPEGLPGVFLLKSLILVYAGLLVAQGLSLVASRSLELLSRDNPPAKPSGDGTP